MHILFVDESGTPPKPRKERPAYFVVGGIIVPESDWHSLRDALLGMKIRRKIRGEFKWRYFSPDNDDSRNPMRHLAQPARDEIRSEIYRIIRQHHGVKSVAAVCCAKAAYAMSSVSSQEDIYKLTYKTVTERFQYFLQDATKEAGKKQNGVIVGDHRGSDDDKALRAHHQMLLHSSAAFVSKYPNLIESLFLQPSHLSIGVQLADMVAGAVWRRFERNDGRWYGEVEPTLRRSPDGKADGFGIIKVPKRGWV